MSTTQAASIAAAKLGIREARNIVVIMPQHLYCAKWALERPERSGATRSRGEQFPNDVGDGNLEVTDYTETT